MSARDRRRDEWRGRVAESVAAWWLRAKGYRVLARRLRLGVGEIDLVVARGRALVLVEVKRRATLDLAAEALGQGRLRRVWRAVPVAAARFGDGWETVRLDAVLVAPWRFPRHLERIAGEDGSC
ncbi:YraN family protein [Parapedomonas caeni]|jgi:putative endonuclease